MAPPEPVITPAPELRKRQNNAQFIGYLSLSGTYSPDQCEATLTFYEGPSIVGCCGAKTVACNLPISCVGGTLTYSMTPSGSITTSWLDKVACTEQFDDVSASICNTAKVYENLNDNIPKTLIFCDSTDMRYSFYRQIPTTSSNVPIVSSTAILLPSITPISPSPSPSPTPKSKAWIAGAVIGPIVGLALIAALILFLLAAKKKKENKTAHQPGVPAMAPVHQSQPPPVMGGYTDTKSHYAGQPDPYGQGSYHPHHSYGGEPMSPVPQYSVATPHVEPQSPLPQHSPGPQYSPPPQHTQLPLQGHQPTNRAAELG